MNTVTYEQVLAMHPCWCSTDNGRRRLKRYADRLGGKATALDILALKRVPEVDRLWLVLREEFIAAPILHEFACRCAERALKAAGVTDKRSWAAIQAKRDWLVGKITDEQLAAALDAALDAAWDAALGAAWAAARAAAQAAARDAAWAAETAERKWQIAELTKMVEEADDE